MRNLIITSKATQYQEPETSFVCRACALESRVNYLLRDRSAFLAAVVAAGISLGLQYTSHQHLFIKLNDCSKPCRLIYKSYAKRLCWRDKRDAMGLLARTSSSRIHPLVICRSSVIILFHCISLAWW